MRLLAILLVLAPANLLLAQDAARRVGNADRPGDDSQLRKYRDIHLDAKAFILRSKKAESDRELIQSVLDMCKLHAEIVSDPRYSGSEILRGYRGSLWRRLTTIKNDVKALIARKKREQERIARQLKTNAATYERVRDDDWLVGGMAETYSLVGHWTGGPSRVVEYSGDGMMGGAPADLGWDLVDLIRETIHPDSWDVNGGPGKAYYYRPLRILVVRATERVHEDLEDFFNTIR